LVFDRQDDEHLDLYQFADIETIKELRQDILSPSNVRALSSASKDFVSMAQLMVGEATERATVTLAPEDRAAKLRELLGKHFPIDTTAVDDDSG
jgi:hypothetical protein